jgi:hypothetical protein
MDAGRRVVIKFARERPKTYGEFRAFVERERPDWIEALVPRHIDAPANYYPQKVLALATIQGALCNQILQDAGLKPDATFAAVEGQTGQLLEFDVPTFYVWKELMGAAVRTALPAEILLDGVPFPFPACVFMFPKGSIRHPSEGECPYIVVSRVAKNQVFRLPLKDVDFGTKAGESAIDSYPFVIRFSGFTHLSDSTCADNAVHFLGRFKVTFPVRPHLAIKGQQEEAARINP